MSEQNLGPYFIPMRGLSERLERTGKREGQFLITLDDRKIYADVMIDGLLTRIPLGGDINTQYIPWELIKEKPFDSLSSDFKVVAENINNESINKIFLADSLKITNKTILDKFSENENGLLYDNQPVGAKGTFVYTGRVDSFQALQQIEDPVEGQVYNVGETNAQFFDKYVYIINPQTENGAWEIFYSNSNYTLLETKITQTQAISAPIFSTSQGYAVGDFVIYNNILYKCSTVHAAGAWDNTHFTQTNIVSEMGSGGGGISGQIVDEPTAAEISTSIANIWG